MSKIGKKSINILEGVSVEIKDGDLEIKGKRGALRVKILKYVKPEIKNGNLSFSIESDSKQAMANWGTIRSLAYNAVLGVSQGFEKILEIEGVGYRAAMEGNDLVLSVGFSHPVKFKPPEGIKISVEKNTIKVNGIDKALVGKAASEIRAVKKPEPYKGKGIRYKGEVIRRKSGKKVAGAGK
ncbi:50S ribosomal protein L6 [Candidatus Wolfebacteria bacterium]|nr:50S ribosomal protein L6 [Candidatus Wolfebacteria bacterium]